MSSLELIFQPSLSAGVLLGILVSLQERFAVFLFCICSSPRFGLEKGLMHLLGVRGGGGGGHDEDVMFESPK